MNNRAKTGVPYIHPYIKYFIKNEAKQKKASFLYSLKGASFFLKGQAPNAPPHLRHCWCINIIWTCFIRHTWFDYKLFAVSDKYILGFPETLLKCLEFNNPYSCFIVIIIIIYYYYWFIYCWQLNSLFYFLLTTFW